MITVHGASAGAALVPVRKDTLAGRVALILKRFILVESLVEGDQMPPERTLAATLDVSPRVVREALGMLVGEGLIVKRHGRGAFVRALDRERLAAEVLAPAGQPYAPADLHTARCALEIGAILLAARHADDADLQALQALMASMKERLAHGDPLVPDDLRFHEVLLRATHNPILIQLEYLIAESIRLAVYEEPALLRRSVRDESHVISAHQAIVDALAAHSGEEAVRAMRAHLKNLLK
jgi:DNA-binding FadR family transcriptional regulator